MHHKKGINKISELKTSFTHCWVEPDFIKSSLKSFTFSSLCKALGPFKLRGYSFESIFTMLLSLPFLGVETVNSMYNHYLIEQTTIKKDVFYRMKNNPRICWREFVGFIYATVFFGSFMDSARLPMAQILVHFGIFLATALLIYMIVKRKTVLRDMLIQSIILFMIAPIP